VATPVLIRGFKRRGKGVLNLKQRIGKIGIELEVVPNRASKKPAARLITDLPRRRAVEIEYAGQGFDAERQSIEPFDRSTRTAASRPASRLGIEGGR
jgi:hypothetical protein